VASWRVVADRVVLREGRESGNTSCLTRLFALDGAWGDPPVGCNRSFEVRSRQSHERLLATLAVTTFGQLLFRQSADDFGSSVKGSVYTEASAAVWAVVALIGW
jgi:hypothetical protein